MALKDKVNTEHSGGKNGGGYWGKRIEAKEMSKRIRREQDKEQERWINQLEEE